MGVFACTDLVSCMLSSAAVSNNIKPGDRGTKGICNKSILHDIYIYIYIYIF